MTIIGMYLKEYRRSLKMKLIVICLSPMITIKFGLVSDLRNW